MPGLRELLKKRDKIAEDSHASYGSSVPDFKFIRTTTESEEVIEPPSHPDDNQRSGRADRRRTLGFRNSSNASITKDPTAIITSSLDPTNQNLPVRGKEEKRLSNILHIGHHRSRSRSTSAEPSANLPEYLPAAPEAVSAPRAPDAEDPEEDKQVTEHREAQWEKRATMLAMGNPLLEGQAQFGQARSPGRSRSPSVSNATSDVNIQEAIRLHESGDLTRSTDMFGRLADPRGENSALAQVLYGLALRHGWGVPVEPERAIHYLSLAASNSASIEEQALASGMKKGGAAKGELVLAIFELANCFRHGWGVKKDAVAARQYYETAANLGDTDAMDEAAWCYLEGFGGKKDKFKAAQYLRLAEAKGSKSVGNSWIWKEKYNPK